MLVITLVLLLAMSAGSVPVPSFPVELPAPDDLLHVYSLPVGQGDAQVVQCPKGHLGIVDLGKRGKNNRFWGPTEIKAFLGSQSSKIHSIMVTHNDCDHYSLLPDTFPNSSSLPNLQHFYISCNLDAMLDPLKNWMEHLNLTGRVRMFNNGSMCGANGVPCDPIDLCPNDTRVTTKVLTVNMGNCSNYRNIDSIVFKVMMGSVSVMLTGDFEDKTETENEGPQQKLVEFYNQTQALKVTVYKLAHHGASSKANKKVFRDAVTPRAVFVSANTNYTYRHPRCEVLDAFRNSSLCQPQVTDPNNSSYCGEHVWPNLDANQVTQANYTCGPDSLAKPREGNTHALYTTMPSNSMLNVVHFATDGEKWGFKNDFIMTTNSVPTDFQSRGYPVDCE